MLECRNINRIFAQQFIIVLTYLIKVMMKKVLFSLAAIVCCVMTMSVLTSCSSDENSTEFVNYRTRTVGDNAFGDMVCSQMDAALSSAFGNQVAYKRDDSKAISVCDAIANKEGVKENALIGTINLEVAIASTDPNANNVKVIKTYKFPL